VIGALAKMADSLATGGVESRAVTAEASNRRDSSFSMFMVTPGCLRAPETATTASFDRRKKWLSTCQERRRIHGWNSVESSASKKPSSGLPLGVQLFPPGQTGLKMSHIRIFHWKEGQHAAATASVGTRRVGQRSHASSVGWKLGIPVPVALLDTWGQDQTPLPRRLHPRPGGIKFPISRARPLRTTRRG